MENWKLGRSCHEGRQSEEIEEDHQRGGGGGDLRCFSCERKKRKTNGEVEKNRKEIFLASNKYSIIFEFIEVTITL